MKRSSTLPLLALAVAACSDPATGPSAAPTERLAAMAVDASSAPKGTHLQTGAPGCTIDGLSVSCSSYELAGVGNANARATLDVVHSAIVDCRNHGGKVVPVKAQAATASFSTGQLEPKNGRLTVPALSSGGAVPSPDAFTAQATCPNGNWTKEVRAGSLSLASYTYALTFAGFGSPYILITGP
jgi:hypothetical protein